MDPLMSDMTDADNQTLERTVRTRPLNSALSMKNMNIIISIILIVIATFWGLATASICWYAGDYMIGFSPFIMFCMPFAGIYFIIGGTIAAARKSKLIIVSSILGASFIACPFILRFQIIRTAWNTSINWYSDTNLRAIQNTDFSIAVFNSNDFPDERRMVAVEGFKWYCKQHIAAPNDIYLGFLYNSVPHIYVNRIRHGSRGVAWIEESTMIQSNSSYKYKPTGIDNWYIWTYR